VLCVCGDGGFMYTMQELATAVQHNIGVAVAVFNDGAFGNVRRMQQQDHGGKLIATELKNPDFVKLAESFGANGVRVHRPDELAGALRAAFGRGGPTVIEIPVGEMAAPWPFILMPKVR
jgi:acetolactate synthase I/II/III large subunit